jgi:hypothetical protein
VGSRSTKWIKKNNIERVPMEIINGMWELMGKFLSNDEIKPNA